MQQNQIQSYERAAWKTQSLVVRKARQQLARFLDLDWISKAFLAYSFFYLVLSLSPSSYGLVLQTIGLQDAGPLLGLSRSIRSDEWAVTTPFLQATVNNEFARFNATSFYNEDLRSGIPLPLADWGLAFKPYLWGYLFLKPSLAYSLTWVTLTSAFYFGFREVFKKIIRSKQAASALSLIFFFVPAIQFWWTTNAVTFAIFPWIVVLLVRSMNEVLRGLLFFWVGTVWLIGGLYPAFVAPLAFVGLAVALALRGKRTLRQFAASSLAALGGTMLAALTTATYLFTYLSAQVTTIYPGQRRSDGGAEDIGRWMSQFFPSSVFDLNFTSLTLQNICEAGVAGSYLTVFLLVFMNYRDLLSRLRSDEQFRISSIILLAATTLMNIWLLVPLPAWAGSVLLWNMSPSDRFQVAEGLLLMFFVVFLFSGTRIELRLSRATVYGAIVMVNWAVAKAPNIDSVKSLILNSAEIVVLVCVLALVIVSARRRKSSGGLTAMALLSMLFVGTFNPLQPTHYFFERPTTPAIDALSKTAIENEGILVSAALPGAVQNGLGFKAVAHVQVTPYLKFWSEKYPDMDESEFDKVFNRFAHIGISEDAIPALIQADNLSVPANDFRKNFAIEFGAADPPYKALWLEPETNYTFTYSIEKSMLIDQIQVLIGNSNGTADGVLNVEICTDGNCFRATGAISNSLDNNYLGMNLKKVKEVNPNSKLTLTIRQTASSHPVALWLACNAQGGKCSSVIKLVGPRAEN